MDDIISLAKRRGFIYPGSEIYGGLAGTWDYGPMGIALKRNITNLWWKMFVDSRDDMFGVDAAIIMNPKAWESSGHVSGFSDPLVECRNCNTRQRVDQLPGFSSDEYSVVKKSVELHFEDSLKIFLNEIEGLLKKVGEQKPKIKLLADFIESDSIPDDQKEVFREVGAKLLTEVNKHLDEVDENFDLIKLGQSILEDSKKYVGLVGKKYLNDFLACPNCDKRGCWGTPTQFNMMFKTQVGAMEDESSIAYLRPETAGGMFVNYKNVLDSLHPKLPFGLAQIGKAFRNEIAPRDFIFRVRELEQMEIEYFVKPSEWEDHFETWRQLMHAWITAVGIDSEKTTELNVTGDDLAHYSKRTIDFEFEYPFGKKELYGLAYRTDFDLTAHAKGSSVDLSYFDEETKERFVPHVIEPSFGVERTVLAVLVSAYHEEGEGDNKRVVLKLPRHIAPVKAAISPLLKNKPELVAKAREIYGNLKLAVPQIMWDDNGNIGKRYRRQDEIGTPWCITIDFDTLENNTVTVRDRDTMEQTRIPVSELLAKISS